MIFPGKPAAKKPGRPKKTCKSEGHTYHVGGTMSRDKGCQGIGLVFSPSWECLGEYEMPSSNCMISNSLLYPTCHLDVAFYRVDIRGCLVGHAGSVVGRCGSLFSCQVPRVQQGLDSKRNLQMEMEAFGVLCNSLCRVAPDLSEPAIPKPMKCPGAMGWLQSHHNTPPVTWMLHFIGNCLGGCRVCGW